MSNHKTAALAGLLAVLPVAGCAIRQEQVTARFIKDMDAKPPEQRVPNWESTRALMLREAPRVGEVAPDFMLPTRDGSGSMGPAQFEGDRPVMLIFGSWT